MRSFLPRLFLSCAPSSSFEMCITAQVIHEVQILYGKPICDTADWLSFFIRPFLPRRIATAGGPVLLHPRFGNPVTLRPSSLSCLLNRICISKAHTSSHNCQKLVANLRVGFAIANTKAF